jgi:hypothetical protein
MFRESLSYPFYSWQNCLANGAVVFVSEKQKRTNTPSRKVTGTVSPSGMIWHASISKSEMGDEAAGAEAEVRCKPSEFRSLILETTRNEYSLRAGSCLPLPALRGRRESPAGTMLFRGTKEEQFIFLKEASAPRGAETADDGLPRGGAARKPHRLGEGRLCLMAYCSGIFRC